MPESVEEKLAVFRSKKKKEENQKLLVSKFTNHWSNFMHILSSPFRYIMPQHLQDMEPNKDDIVAFAPDDDCSNFEDDDMANEQNDSAMSLLNLTKLDWLILSLKIALWMILWKLSVIAEVGAVFFLLSGFVLIWYNTRTGPSKSGAPSAYSVFNKDFKTITGTFTAEQFERTLLNKKIS